MSVPRIRFLIRFMGPLLRKVPQSVRWKQECEAIFDLQSYILKSRMTLSAQGGTSPQQVFPKFNCSCLAEQERMASSFGHWNRGWVQITMFRVIFFAKKRSRSVFLMNHARNKRAPKVFILNYPVLKLPHVLLYKNFCLTVIKPARKARGPEGPARWER